MPISYVVFTRHCKFIRSSIFYKVKYETAATKAKKAVTTLAESAVASPLGAVVPGAAVEPR